MSDQLSLAASIMVAGMLSVFVFLVLLIVAMGILRRLFGDDALPTGGTKTQHQSSGSPIAAAKLAAISIAIQRYRQDHEA